MKKLLTGILSISACFSLFACSKKNNTTRKTTKETTTTVKKTTIDIHTDNNKYESDFNPIVSESLPRIDINVNDASIEPGHEMDFVTQPNRTNKWDYTSCNVTVTDGDTVSVDGKAAGVKVRGNYTTDYDKKPLRIKFDKKQSMLDLHGGEKYKNWLLLAEYKDWSMLRNSSAFYLAHLMDGNYVSDFRLVNVYINNQYWGVYLLCEQQEVKEGRISIAEAQELEDSTYYTGTDIGYFLEFDGYYSEEAELEQFTIKYDGLVNPNDNRIFTQFQKGFTIKSDVYSKEQHDFIQTYMQGVWSICYNAIIKKEYYSFDSKYSSLTLDSSLHNSYEAISKIIDVDSLVNSYLLADIACDTDIAWSSFFMDVDFSETGSKKLKFEAPWDFDSGFGNTKGCLSGEGAYASNIITNASWQDAANPWYMLLYTEDWFKALVRDKFNSLKNNGSFTKIIDYITTTSTKYEADFVANYAKWNNCGHPELTGWEQCEASRACTTQKQSAEYLKTWFNKRINGLDKLYNNK